MKSFLKNIDMKENGFFSSLKIKPVYNLQNENVKKTGTRNIAGFKWLLSYGLHFAADSMPKAQQTHSLGLVRLTVVKSVK